VRVNAWFGEQLPVYKPGKQYGTIDEDKIWNTVQSSFETLSREIIPSVSLKQVVDCREPDRADYQAIVLRGVWTDNAKDWTPSPHRLRVKFHSYDSVPLVKTMGLLPTYSELDPENLTNVQVIDSVFAFSFSSEMRADIAVNLDWCQGNGAWQHTGTADALIKIEFSFAMPGASPQAVEKAVADDVKTAIGRVCALEDALDQWAKLHKPPRKP
jgi:hypothetical protein